MSDRNVAYRILKFYCDGFRSMTLGRTLWTIIFFLIIIFFAVLKMFIFPDVLSHKAKGSDKASYVAGELIKR